MLNMRDQYEERDKEKAVKKGSFNDHNLFYFIYFKHLTLNPVSLKAKI